MYSRPNHTNSNRIGLVFQTSDTKASLFNTLNAFTQRMMVGDTTDRELIHVELLVGNFIYSMYRGQTLYRSLATDFYNSMDVNTPVTGYRRYTPENSHFIGIPVTDIYFGIIENIVTDLYRNRLPWSNFCYYNWFQKILPCCYLPFRESKFASKITSAYCTQFVCWVLHASDVVKFNIIDEDDYYLGDTFQYSSTQRLYNHLLKLSKSGSLTLVALSNPGANKNV
jgi:hypothetical protein